MNVTAIVQARMGSTRLPGKVLMEVDGKPLLGYLIERLSMAKRIDKIVVATSVLSHDAPIEEFCRAENIACFRGSEDDVLDRYYQAAKRVHAQNIMRITGDCPLLEPGVCDRCVDAFFDRKVDYLHTDSSFAEGLDCEIFSADALSTSWNEASLLSEREHVTLFIRNHPEMFTMGSLHNDVDDSMIRITVDCREDFEVVKHIILSTGHENITIEYIRNFLRENPAIAELNSSIVRNEGLVKSLQNDKAVK
jgi:spore coat polysaccharide biosynthesis protein SpsF (cytidylyltransferase family)